MEYLHILIDRTGDMTEFLWAMEREGLVGEHKFMMLLPKITIMKKRTEFLQFPYIEFWENSRGKFKKYRTKKRMIRRLNQADVIIWHSLTMGGSSFIPLLYKHPDLCRKSVWIENGTDAQDWPAGDESADLMQRAVRERIPVVGVPMGADAAYIRSLWPDKKIFETPYPINPRYAEAMRSLQPVKNAVPFVQVGLTSQQVNNHRMLMEALSPLNDEEIKFLFPVNYVLEKQREGLGNNKYRLHILKEADAQWPGRAFKMQCLAPIRAYFSYLSQLEAAVLGNDTAIAATYITFLAAAKHIKIFLPSTSYVYQWLRDIGRPVHTLEELEDTDKDAFLAPDGPFEMPEQLARRLDRDKTMEQWKELFAWMKESVEKNDE